MMINILTGIKWATELKKKAGGSCLVGQIGSGSLGQYKINQEADESEYQVSLISLTGFKLIGKFSSLEEAKNAALSDFKVLLEY